MIKNPQDESITSIDAAIQYAASKGVAITPEILSQIQEAQNAALAENQKSPTKEPLYARFNRTYRQFLSFVSGAGDVIVRTFSTLIVSLGVPVSMFMIVVVEMERVASGIRLFTSSDLLSFAIAFVAVFVNLATEFVIAYIDHKAGYLDKRSIAKSLRLAWYQVTYWLSLNKNWQPRELPPSKNFRSLLQLASLVNLGLAVAGSMRGMIEKQGGDWLPAIPKILLNSDLITMTTWVLGGCVAYFLVKSSQVYARYLAIRSYEIEQENQIKLQSTSEVDQGRLDRIGANVILAAVIAERNKKKSGGRNISGHFLDISSNVSETYPDLGISGDAGQQNGVNSPPKTVRISAPELMETFIFDPGNISEIRQCFIDGKTSQAKLAARIGITPPTLSRWLAKDGNRERVLAYCQEQEGATVSLESDQKVNGVTE